MRRRTTAHDVHLFVRRYALTGTISALSTNTKWFVKQTKDHSEREKNWADTCLLNNSFRTEWDNRKIRDQRAETGGNNENNNNNNNNAKNALFSVEEDRRRFWWLRVSNPLVSIDQSHSQRFSDSLARTDWYICLFCYARRREFLNQLVHRPLDASLLGVDWHRWNKEGARERKKEELKIVSRYREKEVIIIEIHFFLNLSKKNPLFFFFFVVVVVLCTYERLFMISSICPR